MKKKISIVVGILIVLLCAFVVGKQWMESREGAFVARCEGTQGEKTQCWEDSVRETLKKHGPDDAFRLIAAFYDHDPGFAATCHAMVHIIGQTAYSQFRSTKEVPLSSSSASCAFGFYHGFMEMLIARKGTIDEAREFCAYVDKTLGETTPNAKYGCYHGIGHGSTDVHNPKYYGDEEAIVGPALKNCEAFAQNADQLKLCTTGIFDSISIAYYNNGENGLVMKKEDPLWLCHAQPTVYKESCYRDMMPAVIWMGENDLSKAAPIVFTHVEQEYMILALEILAENSVRFIINKTPTTSYVPLCRSFETRFHIPCIEGLASGVMQFGPPEREYEGALSFCADSMLTEEERVPCVKKVLGYAQGRYSKKKVADICSSVAAEYQQYCASQ